MRPRLLAPLLLLLVACSGPEADDVVLDEEAAGSLAQHAQRLAVFLEEQEPCQALTTADELRTRARDGVSAGTVPADVANEVEAVLEEVTGPLSCDDDEGDDDGDGSDEDGSDGDDGSEEEPAPEAPEADEGDDEGDQDEGDEGDGDGDEDDTPSDPDRGPEGEGPPGQDEGGEPGGDGDGGPEGDGPPGRTEATPSDRPGKKRT